MENGAGGIVLVSSAILAAQPLQRQPQLFGRHRGSGSADVALIERADHALDRFTDGLGLHHDFGHAGRRVI